MQKHYEATWESICSRPVPSWFADAKFGIFVHWGLYSVPAYTRRDWYAEWYQMQIEEQAKPEVLQFHNRVYGETFRYADFAGKFKAELFDAQAWISLFERAGARYMNFTSKHHDGFCMYPTQYAWNWNSSDVGPHRDFCRELREACEGTQVRFGLYHSIYEWFHPLYLQSPERYATEHLLPMLKELIENYRPQTLFTDGEWDHPSDVWHSTEFLQWLFNESSVRDTIVVNDRWGKETREMGLGGNLTTEYGSLDIHPDDSKLTKVFEECRGIGKSFGFNRAEGTEDYLSAKELIELLVSLAARGGNLLLNVGPAGDGRIPVIMEERLLQIGKWLAVNGEAIYNSRKYCQSSQDGVCYTQRAGNIYVFFSTFPFGELPLADVPFDPAFSPVLLGYKGEASPVKIADCGGKTKLIFDPFTPDALGSEHVYCVKIAKHF